MNFLKTTTLGLLALTSISAFAQNKAHYLMEDKLAINGYRFYYGSDLNGVCKALGYEKAAKGSENYIGVSTRELVVSVDENAEVIEGFNGSINNNVSALTELVCLNKISDEPLFNLVHSPVNMPYGMLVAATDTNQNGVCKRLGYDAAATNAAIINGHQEDLALVVVDQEGEITHGTRTTESYVLNSVLCVLYNNNTNN